jgi:hypothetical protein
MVDICIWDLAAKLVVTGRLLTVTCKARLGASVLFMRYKRSRES